MTVYRCPGILSDISQFPWRKGPVLVEPTNSNSETRGVIRLDWDQVGLDNGHVVAINREDVMRPSRSIDQFQDMLLPLSDRRVEVRAGARDRIMAFSVHDDTIRPGEAPGRSNLFGVAHERRVVDVVLYEYGPEIDVPAAAGRSVDDEGPCKTVGVLERYEPGVMYMDSQRKPIPGVSSASGTRCAHTGGPGTCT